MLSVSLCLVYKHCIFTRDEAAEKTDAGRVAPISDSVWCLRLVVAFAACVLCLRLVALGPPYHTTKALLAEYLTSYTNTLQFIDYQYFT